MRLLLVMGTCAVLSLLAAACGGTRAAARPLAPRPWLAPELEVTFESRMSGSFRLQAAQLTLDRHDLPVLGCAEGGCGEGATRPVFAGRVEQGEHELAVNITLQGQGSGVFAYLRGYVFHARSRRTLEAEPGRRVTLRVIATEQGGPTTPLENRPTVTILERRTDL